MEKTMGEKLQKEYSLMDNIKVVNEDGTPYKPSLLEKIDDWCFDHLWLYGYGYRIWKEYICPSAIKRMVKHFFQRRFHGFDDTETWDLGDKFYRWIYPRLKRFTEITMAYPMNYKNHKEWIDELKKRVKQLESFIDVNEFDFTHWEFIPEDELDKLKKDDKIKIYMINATAYDYCVKDFNEWFAKNVNQLWW